MPLIEMDFAAGIGGVTNAYAENVGSAIVSGQDYTVDCGFEPNYIAIFGTSTNVGSFVLTYLNGTKKESWGTVGYRTSGNYTVTTNSNGCVIKIHTDFYTLSDIIIMCANV